MDNQKGLLNFIEGRVSISDEERKVLLASFKVSNKNKNDYLIKHDDRARHLYFIVNGSIRIFKYDSEGNEITTHLFRANSFVTSFESFVNATPSDENVQCISQCEYLSISKEDYDAFYKTVKAWPIFCRKIYEDYIKKKDERIYAFQHLSATERYQNLMETEPDVVLNTEVKYLASYLGIKPQSLSRIRSSIK